MRSEPNNAPAPGDVGSATPVVPEDAELVRRVLNGDSFAFGMLIDRYQGLLTLIAYRRTGRPAECEDLVQEAFVRAFKALPTLEKPERFKSWIAQIVSNAALDRVRRRSPVVSFDQESGMIEALPPREGTRPSGRIMMDEQRQRLIAAIESLHETYQIPIVLRYLEGMSHADIAQKLGLREEAVRKRICRANEMLHKIVLSGQSTSGRKG
jgi:RNA polymerase sigma-70 factor (ECF subfamily)